MSTPIIQPHEKKAFIYWFLNQYELKIQESHWILTYLANNTKILQNVHFVRNAKICPRSIIISSNCSEGVAFRFYRKHIATSDPEKAFHDIRLNRDDPLYVELRYDQWEKCPNYAFILEENPYISYDDEITFEDRRMASLILDYSLLRLKMDMLLTEIDQALDNKDRDKFLILTKQLKEIESFLTNQPIS